MFHALLLKCENMFCQIIASTVSLTEELHSPNSLHAGYFSGFLSSADFFQINFFEKMFQEYQQGVKQFGSRSGPTFVGLDLGPNCLQRP